LVFKNPYLNAYFKYERLLIGLSIGLFALLAFQLSGALGSFIPHWLLNITLFTNGLLAAGWSLTAYRLQQLFDHFSDDDDDQILLYQGHLLIGFSERLIVTGFAALIVTQIFSRPTLIGTEPYMATTVTTFALWRWYTLKRELDLIYRGI